MTTYDAKDPREVGLYTIGDAAHILGLAESTLSSWFRGRPYPTSQGIQKFAPVIEAASVQPLRLSFSNLVEAHVLKALRKKHRISLSKVRQAIDYLSDQLGSARPLTEKLQTDNINLFINHFGTLLNLTSHGQMAMKEILSAYLERIEWDVEGVSRGMYPFTSSSEQDPRIVWIDPRVSFGRPVIKGKGVPTRALAARYKAGDSIATLSEDYDLTSREIEEAIRYELAA